MIVNARLQRINMAQSFLEKKKEASFLKPLSIYPVYNNIY
ncbi:protein of unknown function [Petrocella atlantisensis]|uniref:Uncharacterized protein n=1 Tax=Petrocella atlantisensis TaxID=2173034 RepID=A0A3P7RYM9_9FIRM|nr:protein of unknown function [Petrocella atlantisensis]